MDERSLPLDPQELAAAPAPSTTSRSAAPARKSETTASTAIPQPAIQIPVCPVGTNTDFSAPAPCREVELQRDGLLADRAVGADGEHDRRRHLRFSPVGTSRSAGGLRRSRSSTPCSAASSASSGSSEMNSWRPLSTSSPLRDPVLQQLAARRAGSVRPASRRRRRAVSGSNSMASVDAGDDRYPLVGLPRPRRVEDRDHRVAGRSGRCRAPSCRSAGRRSSPQRGSGTACVGRRGLVRRREAGRRRRARRRARGLRARRMFPSRSTWSQRLAIAAPAAMPSPDSTMQPSMTPSPSARAACAIRTASRIPPDLASLMLTPWARSAHVGDVRERVAVLVDVDRDRRAGASALRRPDRPPAAAARSTRRRARRAAAAPRAPRRATSTR